LPAESVLTILAVAGGWMPEEELVARIHSNIQLLKAAQDYDVEI